MLEGFKGAILVERANHLISNGCGSEGDRKKWAQQAVKYLSIIGCTDTPYWNKLLEASGLEHVPESSQCESLVTQRAISHDYVDAIALLEAQDVAAMHCRNLEAITEILLLSHNFKGLEEIEYQITGIDSTHQETLGEEEAESLRRIKILMCASLYLRGKYFDCSSSFFKLLTSEPKIIHSLTHEPQTKFLTNSEFLTMIVISTMLAVPLDNYEDFVRIEELVPFQRICPTLYMCLGLLINTSFRKFFQHWHGDMNRKCVESFLLDQSWGNAQSMMRDKIYFFYLRISDQIEISYLSRILGIQESQVRNEVEELINSAHLSFEIRGDLVSYRHTHFLENVVSQLKTNENLISARLDAQNSKNKNLRDLLQSMIIGNDKVRNVSSENVAGDTLQNLKLFESRRDDIDNMDIDEINDVSDVESHSLEIGN